MTQVSMMQPIIKNIVYGIILCCTFSDAGFIESSSNEPCGADLYRCNNNQCTFLKFRCDGDNDCGDSSDEYSCRSALTDIFGYQMIKKTREKTAERLIQIAKNYSTTDDWDYAIARTVLAIYLTNETYFTPGNETGDMLANKLRLQMRETLIQKNIEDIPTGDLAVFLNAFLAACINPRNFNGMDLVAELRVRMMPLQYINPYVLLALCNAGENMTAGDISKLTTLLTESKGGIWTDMQAYTIIALSCAAAQRHHQGINMTTVANNFHRSHLPPQDTNEIVDNIKTTALIMQAFIAAGIFPDRPLSRYLKYFNSKRASQELIKYLQSNESVDDVLNSYYVLPVLSYKSLANISFSHCMHHISENNTPIAQKIQLVYSLWFGIDKYMEKTIRLRVPANENFQKTMDIASKLDNSFRYNSTLRRTKRYIYSISGKEDDPENDSFWFLYRVTNNLATQITENYPLEYYPKNNEHLVMWFRKGPWAIEE